MNTSQKQNQDKNLKVMQKNNNDKQYKKRKSFENTKQYTSNNKSFNNNIKLIILAKIWVLLRSLAN
jgi:hypothetical protein